MFRNYIKIAWRNLIKNKAHSLINITGLSVGMAVAMLIGFCIWDELSYDKYHQNYNRIVQVWQNQTINGVVNTQLAVPVPVGLKLREDYKNDFKYVVLSTWTNDHVLSWGENKINKAGNYMQAEAPSMFTLKMLKGTRSGLSDPSAIILSESTSKALFGNTNPMDKVIKIDNKWNVKVTGVYEDLPRNTSLHSVTFIAPWDLYMTTQPNLKTANTRWGDNSWQVFAQLNSNADLGKVSAKIKDLKAKNIAGGGYKEVSSFHPALFLHPMSKWYLYSDFKNGVSTGGEIQVVWMFSIIGVFVLLLACINFMNLSTARSEKRAKEVGIRKTLGSVRQQLIGQFFIESLLVSLCAFFISLILDQLFIGWFNQVADKQMHIPWSSTLFWVIGLSFSVFTGLIAGSYPAFYLSSFRPVKVLKGTFKAGKLAAIPRKVLVVLQFTVSVTLIIGTIIIFRQVQYSQSRPVGYNRTGLLQIEQKTADIHKNFQLLRRDLIQSGAVIDAAESGSPLTAVWSNGSGAKWRGKAPGQQDDFGTIKITAEFGKTAGWKIIDGRDFSSTFATDSTGLILNEAAAKFMNFKHPVGEIIDWGKNFHVIGVIKDMVMSSPYEPVKPTVFALSNNISDIVNVRLNPALSTHEALSKIEPVFKRYDPGSPFVYKFTDDEYEKKFGSEKRIGKLAGVFTILAIFISCMGLFGMASFMAEQRTKEIGVRKVLGASVIGLWRLLSTEFVILVTISLAIAIPIAYYCMHGWLQDYKYRTELSWWIFALTGLGAIMITLLTVSYQSIKAALSNPINSLRSE